MIIAEFADLSIVKSFKGITVQNEVGVQHANNLHLRSIFLDFIFLIEKLDLLVAKLHEYIIEHNSLHGVVCWDLESHDLPIAELFFIDSALFERNQSTTFVLISLCQVNEKALKLSDGDVTSSILVIFPP